MFTNVLMLINETSLISADVFKQLMFFRYIFRQGPLRHTLMIMKNFLIINVVFKLERCDFTRNTAMQHFNSDSEVSLLSLSLYDRIDDFSCL